MEKIYFDEETYLWKGKLNLYDKKNDILNIVEEIIKNNPQVELDGYRYKEISDKVDFIGNILVDNILDEIINISLNQCKNLYQKNPYNKINMDSWVNVVRSELPVQTNFKDGKLLERNKYHNHVDLQVKNNSFYPNFTWIYYIQMPDIMENEDGVLYIAGKNKKEYWVRPEVDDLIIILGDTPHAPNNAPKATKDRIVLAGNVGFEFIKQQKSFI